MNMTGRWRSRPVKLPHAVFLCISYTGFLMCSAVLSAILAGCASPGEPVERKPPVPQAVMDLAASQSGNDVILTFTVPKQGLNHLPLKQSPSLEIYRGAQIPVQNGAANGATSAVTNLTLLATIPSGMVSSYARNGQVRYMDSLAPSDFHALANQRVEYAVRAFVVSGQVSANSNSATLKLLAPPTPIEDLASDVTHAGISLKWTAPAMDMAGDPVAIGAYRVYRQEAKTAASPSPLPATGAAESEQFASTAELAPSSTSYLDSGVRAGTTYVYSVRSLVDHGGQTVESADSNLITVTDKTSIPPAAPESLVVAPVPAQSGVAPHVEISWQISPETDVAGYNVYRGEDAVAPGQRQNTELLPTPAFRDMNVAPGRRYFYTVTAVDRSGNESAPSAPVPADVPGSNP